MNDEIIFLVEESPKGDYEAKALDYTIFTEADSLPEPKRNIQEARIESSKLLMNSYR